MVQGKISLLESFCRVQNGELFLLNANIAKFEQASDYDQHQASALKTSKNHFQSAFIHLDVYTCHLYMDAIRIRVSSPLHCTNKTSKQEKRKRKLLVSKKELLKLKSRQNEGGLTIVPTKMYFRGPYLKLEVAVAR